MKSPRLTVGDVIDRLGGNRSVAAKYGVGPTAVCNWRTWGRFPPRLHYRISQDCRAAGIRLPKDFFDRMTTVESGTAA